MTAPYLARRLLTETPGWSTTADVIVVGSGIAGLTVALRSRAAGLSVLLVTKTDLSAGATAWAQGGIAAALGPEDCPDEHITDTLAAGVGLCDPSAVRVLAEEGPEQVRSLVDLGARFEHDDHGDIALTREGGHRRDRIAHAGGDATGLEISRALLAALDRIVQDPRIEVIEHALVTDVVTDDEHRACGVMLHVLGSGRQGGVGLAGGRAIVLATGGLGQVYAATTNPPVATGDGVAAALRAGAEVTDLEFVQFHPTVLWLGRSASGQQPLISEAVRGEGAILRDVTGRRFMSTRHALGDLAPRDVVAKSIVAAMADTGAEHVWLDARHLGRQFLERRFPTIVARCRDHGIDPVADLVPVAPAQHYASGGIRTDLLGRTTVESLYACGEVSATGVHGANRLASNSLLEGLVWGQRIAEHLSDRLNDGPTAAKPPTPRPAMMEHRGRPGLLESTARAFVQSAMTGGAGVIRSTSGLTELRQRLSALATERTVVTPGPRTWETTNLYAVATVLAAHAQARTETRGGHWHSDHPDRDDRNWRGRLVSRLGPDGTLQTWFEHFDGPAEHQSREHEDRAPHGGAEWTEAR